ncbi:MAG TPA: tyrosine-type recombinase/integrase, partial [Caldilineaceae bacterium]|nr:tyrosine-type recombinase/integrase [Caldilineaceae bacterium]
MAERLTEIGARKTLAPVRGQSLLWDTVVKGFALRITPGITIGSFPDWSVQAARARAKELKREVDSGHDPMAQRHADRAAATLQDLWERYQVEYLPKKAPRSQADERSMWTKIILPRLGKMKVATIDADHVDDLHRDVTQVRGTPVRANRVVEVLRRAFNLAIRWKWLSDNPASGVRKNAEEKRDRFLAHSEIAALALALSEHHETNSANAIKLLMLTGARRSEVLGATWAMFDLENGIWTKPSAHTKQRRIHRVPLSGPARRLLTDIKIEATKAAEAAGLKPSPFVFPGTDGKPLTDIKRSWT